MAIIKFFGTLRLLLKIKEFNLKIENEETVSDLLNKLQSQIEARFIDKLINEEGRLIPGTIILVNKNNILHLNELNTIVKNNDEVVIFPPGAGG
jgi:molybdopterin synthase sulfur carrier subunit